jgi:hypothetical protein
VETNRGEEDCFTRGKGLPNVDTFEKRTICFEFQILRIIGSNWKFDV